MTGKGRSRGRREEVGVVGIVTGKVFTDYGMLWCCTFLAE